MDKVILKFGKDKAIKNHHHWIFSGAVERLPEFDDGDILNVYSAQNEFLGRGYFNKKSGIIGRMLTFDDTPIDLALENKIESAIKLRKELFDEKVTNAYRLINGEGDFFPGLIIDKYDDILVVQCGTLGIEKLKPQILEILKTKLKPKCIYEKSNLPARKEEGLDSFEGLLAGKMTDNVTILENGYKFIVELKESQKTGFYLDQRSNRKLIGDLSAGKKVLNCFGYTGAFSVYAAKGGAKNVDTVDASEKAIVLAEKNFKLNKIDTEKNNFIIGDVFEYLRNEKLDYNLVILDPPAFAKRKSDIDQACRGYKDINRLVLKKIPAQSFVLTCSCSYFVDEILFQKVIFQAAAEAGRNVRIIQKHHLSPDHPINIYQPESEYLKSLLLYVE